MNLLARIDRKRYDVIAIDHNRNNMGLAARLFPEVRTVVADVCDEGAWEKELSDVDVVVQLQAQISAPEKGPYVKNNIRSVSNVLKACKQHKVKHLIHLSSSVVISVAKDHYTETKRAGEALVKKSKVPYTILRPPLMYGCFDIKHLGYLTSLLEASPVFPVPGSGRYMRQPLFVEDMCSIIIKIIERKPSNKTYGIIGKERIDFIDLMKTIARLKKKRRLFVNIPIPLFIVMLKSYSFLTRKKPFVPDQLRALTAGDDFPVTPWEKEFRVRYTPFEQGIKKMLKSPYYPYRKEMRKSA